MLTTIILLITRCLHRSSPTYPTCSVATQNVTEPKLIGPESATLRTHSREGEGVRTGRHVAEGLGLEDAGLVVPHYHADLGGAADLDAALGEREHGPDTFLHLVLPGTLKGACIDGPLAWSRPGVHRVGEAGKREQVVASFELNEANIHARVALQPSISTLSKSPLTAMLGLTVAVTTTVSVVVVVTKASMTAVVSVIVVVVISVVNSVTVVGRTPAAREQADWYLANDVHASVAYAGTGESMGVSVVVVSVGTSVGVSVTVGASVGPSVGVPWGVGM